MLALQKSFATWEAPLNIGREKVKISQYFEAEEKCPY